MNTMGTTARAAAVAACASAASTFWIVIVGGVAALEYRTVTVWTPAVRAVARMDCENPLVSAKNTEPTTWPSMVATPDEVPFVALT